MLFLDQILNEKAIGIYRQKIVLLCRLRLGDLLVPRYYVNLIYKKGNHASVYK